MPDGDPAAYVARNRRRWDERRDDIAAGRRQWQASANWGIWSVPDSDVGLLARFTGADTVELGCGTGYVSAWLARQGCRPTGVDVSREQLRTARRLQDEFDLHFPLVQAAAEQVPLREGAFDLVVSEYGAAIWSDPYLWIPEAARLLRPGGELVFLANATLLVLCQFDADDIPADLTLKRPYFDLHRVEWPDDPGVEFHLGFGDWIRLFRACGLAVEDLVELRPAQGSTTRYSFVDLEWARQFPSEQIWRARKC
jgi:SAM-dependent methyltransferase